MTTYETGQTLSWGLTTKDSAGTLANPAVGPSATVTLPDGTTGAAGVTTLSTGNFRADFIATMAGRYRIEWSASGENSGGFPYSDVADVWPPGGGRAIISLSDARAAINLPAAQTASDEEIRLYVHATTEVIEGIVGPILPVVKTQAFNWARGDTQMLFLDSYPTSITSVTEDGTVLSSTDYRLTSGGVLRRLYGVWGDEVTVVYETGWDSIPPSVILAAREEVRFLWQAGQTAARPTFGSAVSGSGYVYTSPQGFAVPRRVIELLSDGIASMKPVGFA